MPPFTHEFAITPAGGDRQHLKVLRDNGFASVRPEGQRRLYAVNGRRYATSTSGSTLPPVLDSPSDALATEIARGQAPAPTTDGRQHDRTSPSRSTTVRRTVGTPDARSRRGACRHDQPGVRHRRSAISGTPVPTSSESRGGSCRSRGDLRVGGRYQLEGNANGTILTCDPPREFTATGSSAATSAGSRCEITGEGSRRHVRTAPHRARRRPLGAIRPWRRRHGLRRRAGRSDASICRPARPSTRRSVNVDGLRRWPPIHEAFQRGVVRGQCGQAAPTRNRHGPPPIGALPRTWEKTRTRSSQAGAPEIFSMRCMPRHLSRSRG